MNSDELRTAGANLREFVELMRAKWGESVWAFLTEATNLLPE